MNKRYRVEGTRSSGEDWEFVFESNNPVLAVECAHYAEGYFWKRVWEDDQLVIERM